MGVGATLDTPSSPFTDFFLASVGGTEIEGAFMMTPPYGMVVSTPASERSIRLIIDHVTGSNLNVPGINGPSEVSDRFALLWTSATGQDAKPSRTLVCYALASVRDVPRPTGGVRPAVHEDTELLVEWSKNFDADANVPKRDDLLIRKIVGNGIAEGHFHFWMNHEPVSLVNASRPTPNGVGIISVYTPPAHRGRGYASSLVADVSASKLAEGKRFCFLFTDASAPTPNKIYRRIGYQEVCRFHEYSFVTRDRP